MDDENGMKISPTSALSLPNHITKWSTELHIHDKMERHYKEFAAFLLFSDMEDHYTLFSLPQRHLRTPYPVSDLMPAATIRQKGSGRNQHLEICYLCMKVEDDSRK